MSKRLAKLNRDKILRLAHSGAWLDLQELAIAMHFDYDKVREWKMWALRPWSHGQLVNGT